MGDPEASASLPIVDISPYLSPSPGNAQAQMACSKQIHEACISHGFFYLTGLGLFRSELDEVLDLAKRFFDLPEHRKQPLSIASTDNGTDGARGWQPLKANVTQGKADMHEGIDWYKVVEEDDSLPLHGKNQWPSEEDLPTFRPAFERWIERMLHIGHALVRATGVGLGMHEEELEELLDLVSDSYWVMRAIGYPKLPPDHDGVSCGAHKDYGCYTLLHCTSQKGSLQVYDSRDSRWIDADPIPECFIVNIGEMWEILTNGLYKSTLHRVVHKGDSYRVSIPFFFEPNWDAEIRPLDACLRVQEERGDPATPLKKSVIYGEFLTKKVAGNFNVGEAKRLAGKRY